MTDDLEAKRASLEAFSRRKNDLSDAGQKALSRLTFNLRVYAEAKDREQEHPDNGAVIKVLGEQNDIDLAILQADMARAKGGGG